MTAPKDHTRDRLIWLEQVQRDPEISSAGFELAFVISGFINQTTGDAWPSQETLARLARTSKRNVRRLIDALETSRHLIVSLGDGRGHTSRYRMNLERGTPVSSFAEERGTPVSSFSNDPRTERGTNLTVKGDTSVRQNTIKNTSINICAIDASEKPVSGRKSKPVTSDVDAEFERFKAAYPRRPKPHWSPARTKFEALLKRGVAADLIIRGAAGYAVAMLESGDVGTQFVKQPITFLNQGLWADYQSLETVADSAPAMTDDQWRFHVERFHSMGAWSSGLGPAPDHPHCRAPANLLRKGAAA